MSSGPRAKKRDSMYLLMLLSGRRVGGALYFDVVIVLNSFSFLLKRHKDPTSIFDKHPALSENSTQ